MVYFYERIQGLSGGMDMDYSNAGEFMIGQAFEAAVRHREGLDEENDEESESSTESSPREDRDHEENENENQSESEESYEEEGSEENENENEVMFCLSVDI